MDGLVQKAIQQAADQKKTSELIPWKLDEAWPQPYYGWDSESETWELKPPQAKSSVNIQPKALGLTNIALYSWNIDFMLPYAEARMKAALAHLREIITEVQSPSTTPAAIVINFQECTPSDLHTISNDQWVRDNFYITDLDSSAWGSTLYGTTMLVDRRLEIASCFRVHFSATTMQRDALFVDVLAPDSTKRIRIGNAHLESLPLDPPLRPAQMHVAAAHMHAEGLAGAVLAGDFNAIQPFDALLHSDNGLKDAYLQLGGQDGEEDGFTWGQQALPALRERFGCSRMDKAYFCGSHLRLQGFARFGADVEVAEGKKRQVNGLLALGFEKAWVTDHLGIKATFSIMNGTRLL